MPSFVPYPGESEEEFRQRTQGGGAVFALHGPNADLRPRPDPVAGFLSRNFADPQRTLLEVPAALGAAGYAAMPESSRTPLAEESPAEVPFSVFAGEPVVEPGQSSAVRGLEGAGSQLYNFAEFNRLNAEQNEDQLKSAEEIGLFPALGNAFDVGIQTMGDTFRPVTEYLFGPPAQPEQADVDPPETAPPGTSGRAGALAFGGGGGVSAVGGDGRQRFTREVRLPAPADSIVPQDEIPTLSQEQIDEYISALEENRPADFEESDIDTNRFLSAMGQALAGAGRAPTMGQALLALGTGGTSAVASHNRRQEELARENEAVQNEFGRRLAEAAFSGQKSAIDSQSRALNQELQRARLEANIQNRRQQAINSAHQVDVNGDQIVISRPEVDEESGTMKVTTEVIDAGSKGKMGAVLSGDSSAINEMELPDIGGVPGQQRLALAGGPKERLNSIIAQRLIGGEMPFRQIQLAKGGGQKFEQQISETARQKLAQRLGLEPDSNWSSITAAWNTQEPADLSVEEAREEMEYQAIIEEFTMSPDLARMAYLGAGLGRVKNGE